MIYKLSAPTTIDDVTEFRVLQWHAAAEQPVLQDALLVELETHKVLLEIRAERAGFLRRVLCSEGDWKAAGSTLAWLSDAAEDPLPDDPAELPDYQVAIEIT